MNTEYTNTLLSNPDEEIYWDSRWINGIKKEYTWEDYRAFPKYKSIIDNRMNLYKKSMCEYFYNHPEKLLEGGIFKKLNYTINKVRKIFKTSK